MPDAPIIDPRIPVPAPDPDFQDLPQRLRDHAAARPDEVAFMCGDVRLTRQQADRRMDRVARLLLDLGVERNQSVAILTEPSADALIVFLAILRAGACAVPLPTMASADALGRMMADSDAPVLFLSAAQRSLAAGFLGDVTSLVEGGRIGLDFDGDGFRSLDTALAGVSEGPVDIATVEQDRFNIIYSSGTTGLPKGIVHSRRMRWTQMVRSASRGIDGPGVTLLSTPLYSNTTMAALLPTLWWGGNVIQMPKFEVEDWLKLAEAERVTHTMLVPVQYQRILAYPDFDRFDLSAFKGKMCTSAPLRAETKRQAITRWPGGLFEVYGLTEGGATCILAAHEHPDKLHTVGRPSPGVDLRLIDEEGREVGPGEVGEIVGHGGSMMQGYHNLPDKTAEILWTSPEGKVFFRQGDMGRFDADGFLELLDRKKDMIISGGFNVYPADLEAILVTHPDVVDAAVIGVPSDRFGETPLALVVRRDGATIDAEALCHWVNGQVGKLQRLSAVEFRDDLPRSQIGKVLKRELRDPFWRGTAA